MNARWRALLVDSGANFSSEPPERVVDFGQPQAERDTALSDECVADYCHHALVAVTGDDASAFLQGQLTSDVSAIEPKTLQLSAWCSSRGRVLLLVHLCSIRGVLHMLIPAHSVEPTLARLKLFVLRAKVTFTLLPDWVVFAAHGRQTIDRLEARANANVYRPTYAPGQIMVLAPVDEAVVLWKHATETARAVGSSAWRMRELRSGLVAISEATADRYVPQMLNLQTLGAVSFTKGCYVGQEIVARTEHLGRLKRRLYRLRGAQGRVEEHLPGTPVLRISDKRKLGEIVTAEHLGKDRFEALAVLEIESAEKETQYESAVEATPLKRCPLPASD